jgi:hypothetical protein
MTHCNHTKKGVIIRRTYEGQISKHYRHDSNEVIGSKMTSALEWLSSNREN